MYKEATYGSSLGKHDQNACKLHMECHENWNLNLLKSHPHPGMVLWFRIGGVIVRELDLAMCFPIFLAR